MKKLNLKDDGKDFRGWQRFTLNSKKREWELTPILDKMFPNNDVSCMRILNSPKHYNKFDICLLPKEN